MGQLFLAEPQLLADFFDRLRKIFRSFCHIGVPQFLVRRQFTGGERTQFAQSTIVAPNIAGDNACGKLKFGDYFKFSDTSCSHPVSKGINQNEERSTMDINDLFDGIMKSINQFADEIAEQRLQEKMQDTGRGPENGGKNAENFEAKEKRV
jgi:hypothetical protein